MSATEMQFAITAEELADALPSDYETIEVPGDYTATLAAVEDYDNRHKGGGTGWLATFRIEGLTFKYWIPHSPKARFKLVEFVHAFIPGFFSDENRRPDGTFPPVPVNSFVGRTVGAHIVLDDSLDTPRKVVQYTFPLEEEVSVEDVPAL